MCSLFSDGVGGGENVASHSISELSMSLCMSMCKMLKEPVVLRVLEPILFTFLNNHSGGVSNEYRQ